jgi:hypothetical protein
MTDLPSDGGWCRKISLAGYFFQMGDKVRVQVPAQFADELSKIDYPMASRPVFRGSGADQLLTLAVTGAGLAADAATILVAKDAARDFLEQVRRWMFRQARSSAGSTLVIELNRRSPSGTSKVRVEVTATSADVIPEADVQAMADLIASTLGTELGQG